MSGFDKGFISKAVGSTNVNQGNTWGPIYIHIKFKQFVTSRRFQRSKTIRSIRKTRQVHKTLGIRRKKVMSSTSSIKGI